MEHTSPCAELIDQMQKITTTVERLDNTHEWVKGIDNECEKIKLDINKLKIQIAVLTTTASFIGGMLGGWAGKMLQAHTFLEIIDKIRTFFC
jgi:phage tail tape-measure protein